MIKHIKLKKGLDLRLQGEAPQRIKEALSPTGIFSVMPADFYGFKPKPVVKPGDHVLVGSPLLINKEVPSLQVTSPVSGTVSAVVRGERRKLLSVDIEADGHQQCKAFDIPSAPNAMTSDAVKSLLLESGLFAFMRQRPYDIVANPNDTPKGIFISLFSKMPLAQDFAFTLKGEERNLQAGIAALSKIATVTIGVSPEQEDCIAALLPNANIYVFSGPNPAGNVGVHINHIAPVNKGEVVWTMGAEEVLFVGRLLTDGKVDMTRTIAIAGAEVKEPTYQKTVIGAPLAALLEGNLQRTEHIRIINGNPLVGTRTDINGHLSARATEVTVIPEGDDKNEVLGWMMPRFKDFSTSRSYFSWLQGKRRQYNLDARIKGGERHIIMSGEYDRYLPMDIYGGYLIKAILAGDLDRMEALGIYEVAPEDFAVAEFADSSKLELQRIVREGLDLLRKEE
ncbi:MAG: Na(+)-translocating NADH-quinone reductase subunit A [Bacteroidaceae bacterium]|nr:Na(+)-translocating NADH-quinone reductase subunit A [Bacteroidaceae bacterium]